MNKNTKIIITIVLTITLLLFIVIGSFIFFIGKSINNFGDEKFYTIGDDKVISITSVVGKRKIKSISSKTSNGVTTKKYKYANVTNVKSDINNYIEELKNNNYINTTDINLLRDRGIVELASYSVNKQNIIIVNISYNLNNYIITIKKGPGSIQPYE